MSERQLCAHCQYRPVRVRADGGGRPARYCSDRCRTAAIDQAERSRRQDQLNQLRALLGLPAGGGGLSSAELRRWVTKVNKIRDAAGWSPVGTRRGRPVILAPHGSHKRYKQGCHDACCRAAEAAYRRDLKARRAAVRVGGTQITPLPGHSERAA